MRYVLSALLIVLATAISAAGQYKCDCLRTGVCTCTGGICQCTQTFVPRPAAIMSFVPVPESRVYQSSSQCVWDPQTGSWNCGQSYEVPMSRSERRAWRRLEKAMRR